MSSGVCITGPARETPGSPPELVDSKSSKSSSFHSSSLSDAISADLSHFEDISLDDINEIDRPERRSQPVSKQPFYQVGPNASHSLRDLTHTSRPGLAAARAAAGQKDAGKTLQPMPRNQRRRPQISTKHLLPLDTGRQSASVSPIVSPHPFLRSPQTFSAASASPGQLRFTLYPQGRRQSWQPGRKTVKELEDEYHDSDEELPDDAVIWNVPISPRPIEERDSSPPGTQRSETDPTPLRTGIVPTAVPRFPSRSSSLTRPASESCTDSSVSISSHRRSSPRSRSLSPHHASRSPEPSYPVVPPASANKTRTDLLSDLSSEARELTQALEAYASQSAQRTSMSSARGKTTGKAELGGNEAPLPHPAAIKLPPVRRGEVMIDPLPISKEKEKVLTRTRPSWLPPKDPKEEKRHLREYQRMMAAAEAALRREEKKTRAEKEKREEKLEEATRTWEEDVLARWDEVKGLPRTRELVWGGVAPKWRGEVWKRAVGNGLGLEDAGIKRVMERATDAWHKFEKGDNEAGGREARGLERVARDVDGVWPELKIFQERGALQSDLRSLGAAWCVYRGDLEYWSGVTSLAATLLLALPPTSTFLTLSNILTRPLPTAILTQNSASLAPFYTQMLDLLHTHAPSLHTHLTNHSLALPPAQLFAPFLDPFLCHPRLDVELVMRIWDLVAFHGDRALLWAVVTVLLDRESELYVRSPEEVGTVLGPGGDPWTLIGGTGNGGVDGFMARMRDVARSDIGER